LVRAVNVRRGLRRKDEKPPEDHWKKRFPEYEAKILDEYYEYKGWNKEGIPKKETLERLELDFVAQDLVRRGILEGNGEGK
jgi:aldehyde:ferredoxin oxidoreductase